MLDLGKLTLPTLGCVLEDLSDDDAGRVFGADEDRLVLIPTLYQPRQPEANPGLDHAQVIAVRRDGVHGVTPHFELGRIAGVELRHCPALSRLELHDRRLARVLDEEAAAHLGRGFGGAVRFFRASEPFKVAPCDRVRGIDGKTLLVRLPRLTDLAELRKRLPQAVVDLGVGAETPEEFAVGASGLLPPAAHRQIDRLFARRAASDGVIHGLIGRGLAHGAQNRSSARLGATSARHHASARRTRTIARRWTPFRL